MKKSVMLIFVVCMVSIVYATPVSENGQLHVCGNNLCNEHGTEIQLRGVGTHGTQWFGNCYNAESIASLANDWGVDVFRLSLYPNQGCYEVGHQYCTLDWVDQTVELLTAQGIYVLLDWHMGMAGDNDPNVHLQNDYVIDYFEHVATQHGDKNNIIYELANEPHGVSLNTIIQYSNPHNPCNRS